jgi:hypothetical protein
MEMPLGHGNFHPFLDQDLMHGLIEFAARRNPIPRHPDMH